MNPIYRAHYATNATPDELRAILGTSWAICRKTERNLARYQRCLTPKEYAAANQLAVARRSFGECIA